MISDKQKAAIQTLGPDCKKFVDIPESIHHKTRDALVDAGYAVLSNSGQIRLTKEGRQIAKSFRVSTGKGRKKKAMARNKDRNEEPETEEYNNEDEEEEEEDEEDEEEESEEEESEEEEEEEEEPKPTKKELTKEEKRALFKAYETAVEELKEFEAGLEAARDAVAETVSEIAKHMGKGPFQWKGDEYEIRGGKKRRPYMRIKPATKLVRIDD